MQQKKFRNLVDEYLNGQIKHEFIPPQLSYKDDDTNTKIDILTPNDITILFGPSGSGKSRIAAYLVRQLLLETPDTFFIRYQNGKKNRVVFIETEMSDNFLIRYHFTDNFYEYDSFEDANRCLDLKNRFILSPFNSLSIKDSLTQLKEIARNEIQYIHDYNIVFFIDNLGSFASDLNSSTNNEFIKDFKATLSKFTVLAVMHSNFKDDSRNKNNPTGALGSSAEKIAQTILQVVPNSSGSLRLTLNKSKTQDDRAKPGIYLSYKEIDGKLIFEEKSQKEYSIVKDFVNESNEKSNYDFEVSNKILNHLNGKSDDHNDRLKQNLVYAFPKYLKKSSMYPKVNKLIDEKILLNKNGYLFHKDEKCH
jgi:hypothetical protein